jgi:hypothetical protein
MSKLSKSSSEFFKKHPLGKSSVIRGFAALFLSVGTGIGVVYLNYHNYWKVTIYRTQTVDFNMLATLLPSKVSTHLLKNDSKGLQEVLDTNYGLFGTIVTNCKSASVDCPKQQIIYGSKIKIEQISNTKQRLVPQGKYAHVWTQKFNGKDTSAHLLKGYDYIILRNPPSTKPDWKFESPRDSQIVVSRQQNVNPIIGRIYFVRGNPPSFSDELKILNPFSQGSRNLVYDAIAGAALLTGILAWILSEIFHYRSRKSDRLEIEAERSIRQAAEQVTQANIDKFNAQEDARLAQARADALAQEKDQAQEEARLAQAKTDEIAGRLDVIAQEKDQAQEEARLAQAKTDEIAGRLDVIAQEKDQAQEEARLAQAKTDEITGRLDVIAQEKDQAQEEARLAQAKADEIAGRLDVIAQEKDQAQEEARLAQAKTDEIAGRLDAIAQEKDQAQEEARLAQAKADEIAQAKDQAREDTRLAQAKADETTQKLAHVTKEKLKSEKNAEYFRISINTKNTSYKELEKENEKLTLRISELEASKIDNNLITENKNIDCSNVYEALMLAGEKFTILNILDNAHKTALDINDSSPGRVYTVLEILAKVGEYHFQQTTNKGIIYLLNEEGVRCSGESRETMNRYGCERDFHHRGEPVRRMEKHIKVGQKLRIYFDVDMENQKIIVGYCGKHLRTATG